MLGTYRLAPRAERVGSPGRDGAVERVVAVDDPPASVADRLQARQPGLRRVEIGQPPVSVELRGRGPGGSRIVVVALADDPAPLFAAAAAIVEKPDAFRTSVVVTLVSPQG